MAGYKGVFKMPEFNFYKAGKAYGELYLQFPKVLLYSKEYSKLSDSAKLAYVIFRDRLQYSIQNNWIDEDNNVYFIFTNVELCELLNKSENTVTKIKKDLEKAGLLLQQKKGFDPVKKKNFPNRLYLADLEVNATDIYQLQQREETLSNQGTTKITARDETIEMPVKQGTVKSEVRQKEIKRPVNQGTAKDEVNLYQSSSKDFKDTKDIEYADLSDTAIINQSFNSKKIDSEKERELMDLYISENMLYENYGEELLHNFKAYSFDDYKTFVTFCEKLKYARKSIEKEYDIQINLLDKYGDFMRDYLNKTFLKCIQKSRYGKAKNIAGYLFIAFKNVFKDYAESQIGK